MTLTVKFDGDGIMDGLGMFVGTGHLVEVSDWMVHSTEISWIKACYLLPAIFQQKKWLKAHCRCSVGFKTLGKSGLVRVLILTFLLLQVNLTNLLFVSGRKVSFFVQLFSYVRFQKVCFFVIFNMFYTSIHQSILKYLYHTALTLIKHLTDLRTAVNESCCNVA